jgi:hypothetical protein
MKLGRHRLIPLLALVSLAAFAAGAAVLVRARAQLQHAVGTYYCPMHPTYTSDKPGDCPICNMRLVKRQPEAAAPAPPPLAAAPVEPAPEPQTICYLHNCPKAHGGAPCPMTVVAKPGEPVTCPVCGTHVAEAAEPPRAGAKKILYWTDPMLPGYKADKPGKSPMGMDLVPVYEEAGDGAAAMAAPPGYAPVLLSPQKQQLIGVKTAPAQRRRLVKTIRTAGHIAYDPELYQAQEEYLQALRAAERSAGSEVPGMAEQSRQLAASVRTRLRLLGLTEALIDELGVQAAPDRRLLLTDPAGEVWLYAPIYEYELPLVALGQQITAAVPSVAGKTLEGAIQAIDPVLDPQTRTARVRALLRDPEHLVKPQMFVNATIAVDTGEALAIPEEAVFSTGTRHLVFVDRGQGMFEPRDVSLGVSADGFRAVTSGIAEGEPVVTSGNFLIDSESRLKAALQGFAGPSRDEAPAHQHGQ